MLQCSNLQGDPGGHETLAGSCKRASERLRRLAPRPQEITLPATVLDHQSLLAPLAPLAPAAPAARPGVVARESIVRPAPISAGQSFERRLQFSASTISAFANACGDANPVHHDAAAARARGHADVIAAGQHTASVMQGLLASHFAADGDGEPLEFLILNVNFAFKRPVLAERAFVLRWLVTEADRKDSLSGWLAHLAGHATLDGEVAPAVIARATVLLRRV